MVEETVIRELTPELLADYLSFFDHDAFVDNPHWASCYCYFYLADHKQKAWSDRTGEENRAAVSQLIARGGIYGYLAYIEGKVVGWCHAAPRRALPNLQDDEELAVEDVERVGAIVCFLVAKPYRRRGVARSLLEAACEGLRRQGMSYAEAYPRTGADSDARNYHGPLALYLEAGFAEVRAYPSFLIVRKSLR